jgi:hypothetical protein
MTNYENLPHRVMASAKLECVACLQGGNQNIAMSLDSVEADLLDNLNERKVISCTACNIYIYRSVIVVVYDKLFFKDFLT